jgi:hypothetical protein
MVKFGGTSSVRVVLKGDVRMLVGTITVVDTDAPGGATADVTGGFARTFAVVGSTSESSAHALANTAASAAPSITGAREARRRRDIVIPRGKGCIVAPPERGAVGPLQHPRSFIRADSRS